MSEKSFISNGVQGLQAFAFSVVTVHDQCITVRRRTTRYHLCTLVHHSFALFLHISLLSLFSCCTFCRSASCCNYFMFYFFCVALFPNCTFSYCTLFKLHLLRVVHFSCCTFLFVALFSCYICFVLHTFRVTLFPCCTFFILHYFQVAHFLCYTFFVLHFSVLHFSFSMLYSFHVAPFFVLYYFHFVPFAHSFHVALFSCCTLFGLHFFHVIIFSY